MEGERLPVAALVVAAFLFGVTFVVVKDAVTGFPPLAFVGWRFLVGAAALLLLALPRGAGVWRDGMIAGTLLFAGYAFQTAGLVTTEAANSALITGLYVVFTPLLAAAWSRRPPSPWVLVGTVVAFIGLALLTVDESLGLARGDLLTVLCALAFAGHIVYLAKSAPHHRVVPFTAVQLLTTAVLGLVSSAVVEGLPLPSSAVWPTIALTALGASAGGFLLQVWAQTRVGPGPTATILALEPVFGVAMAAVVLGERLTAGGWVGAVLILAAIQLVLSKTRPETLEAEAVTPAH